MRDRKMDWFKDQVEDQLLISLSDQQLTQFYQYYEMLINKNKELNLTAITEADEVYIKHFFDSLLLASVVPIKQLLSMIDIGSGAGFPGIPLKIAFPHLELTLLDARNKRILFLRELSTLLKLDRINFLHGRAEDFGKIKSYRQQYDLVSARAVAKLNILTEYCLPFVKLNGMFVAMKGAFIDEEIKGAVTAVKKLGGEISREHIFSLPQDKGKRNLIVIQKSKNTPIRFPRRAGIPERQPI